MCSLNLRRQLVLTTKLLIQKSQETSRSVFKKINLQQKRRKEHVDQTQRTMKVGFLSLSLSHSLSLSLSLFLVLRCSSYNHGIFLSFFQLTSPPLPWLQKAQLFSISERHAPNQHDFNRGQDVEVRNQPSKPHPLLHRPRRVPHPQQEQ